MSAFLHRLSPRSLLWLACACLLIGSIPARAQTGLISSQSNWPSDIDRQSGFRLPIPPRDALEPAAKAIYDRAVSATPDSGAAGLQGPSGILLYSPQVGAAFSSVNGYLRRDAKIPPRQLEVAILVTARAFDSQYEWAFHEPVARKEGVPDRTIDAIKYNRPTTGLDAEDAYLIELGRQLWRDHRVSSETFAEGKKIFGPKKLIDFVMLMGNYAATAALLSLVDMQVREGEEQLLPIR